MKKAISITAEVLVFVLVGLFILRCCMVADTSVFSKPKMTDALREAYADGVSTVFIHTQTSELSTDGYFKAFNMFYNAESGELQLAVRWNDSTYEKTGAEKGTEFAFYVTNDTTGEKYDCTAIESDKRAMYNYRRIVAEGVALASDEQLTAVMTYGDGGESSQVVKYDGQPFKEYTGKIAE